MLTQPLSLLHLPLASMTFGSAIMSTQTTEHHQQLVKMEKTQDALLPRFSLQSLPQNRFLQECALVMK